MTENCYTRAELERMVEVYDQQLSILSGRAIRPGISVEIDILYEAIEKRRRMAMSLLKKRNVSESADRSHIIDVSTEPQPTNVSDDLNCG